jgi:propionyl-CoA synthetase
VLKAHAARDAATIEKEIITLVREKIGTVASFKIAIAVNRLAKTRSGNILRGTISRIADHEPWTMPVTIEDAAVLDEVSAALRRTGCEARTFGSAALVVQY